jgi:hypothetical protein
MLAPSLQRIAKPISEVHPFCGFVWSCDFSQSADHVLDLAQPQWQGLTQSSLRWPKDARERSMRHITRRTARVGAEVKRGDAQGLGLHPVDRRPVAVVAGLNSTG